MKAAVLYGKEDIRVENVPDLKLDDYLNVLVKVKAAGICGTDIHFYEWLYPDRVPRFAVLGHEFAGEVVAVGEGVTNVKVGDRVAVEPLNGCGNCAYCRSGDYHLCKNLKQSGKHYSGGFAEYTKVNCNKCVKIPENVCWKVYRTVVLVDMVKNRQNKHMSRLQKVCTSSIIPSETGGMQSSVKKNIGRIRYEKVSSTGSGCSDGSGRCVRFRG